jgi:predicted nuclease of predicted toxin-antitoxin system
VARLYADENFPLPVVEFLRASGHDVLTAREAGQANLKIPDQTVLSFATGEGRAVLTCYFGTSGSQTTNKNRRYTQINANNLRSSAFICGCSFLPLWLANRSLTNQLQSAFH